MNVSYDDYQSHGNLLSLHALLDPYIEPGRGMNAWYVDHQSQGNQLRVSPAVLLDPYIYNIFSNMFQTIVNPELFGSHMERVKSVLTLPAWGTTLDVENSAL